MSNGTLIILVLLLMFQTTATAEMYRCQTSEGRITFTDTPLNLSSDCQRINEEPPQEAYSSPPTQSSSSSPRPANTPAQQPADRPVEKADLDSWTSRASTLVDDYHAAVKKRYRQSLMLEKRKALQEIGKIKEEKHSLLEEVKNSTLNRQQREEVRKILNDIP